MVWPLDNLSLLLHLHVDELGDRPHDSFFLNKTAPLNWLCQGKIGRMDTGSKRRKILLTRLLVNFLLPVPVCV